MHQNPADDSHAATPVSRRALLAATGGGLLTGCLGEDGSTPTANTRAGQDETSTATTSTTVAPGSKTSVHVDDYGATPDDDSDDTDAVLEAFQAASDTGATIEFGAGTYHLAQTDEDYRGHLYAPLFDLRGYEDLTIRGDDTTIQRQNWGPTFYIFESTNVTVEGLTLDWANDMPFTEGTVVEETADYVDIEVKDGFDVREGLRTIIFFPWDIERGRMAGTFFNNSRRDPPLTEDRGDGVLRCPKNDNVPDEFRTLTPPADAPVSQQSEVTPVEPGDGMVVLHNQRGANAFRMYQSDDVTLRDITIHAAPGMSVNGKHVADLTIENVALDPAEGRWWGPVSDGFNIGNPSGELRLSDITVRSIGDDHLNFNVIRDSIVDVPDDRTLTLDTGLSLVEDLNYTSYAAGENIAVVLEDKPLTPEFTATVTDVSVEKSMNTKWVGTGTITLSLDSAVPQSVRAAANAKAYTLTRQPDAAIVENATVQHMRGGGRFRVPNVTIRNSLFEDLPGAATWFAAQSHKGVAPVNATIEGNTFRRAPFRPGTSGAAISTSQGLSGDLSAGVINDVTIRENTFEHDQAGIPAIILNHLADATIADNDFSGMPGGTERIDYGPVNDCDSITVDGETGCFQPR
jgi:hypothetical protein